ncbi:MAG: homocysteine S-methyltransferase family protein [Lachnospiraceae bacterium]|nr:homocysteine S-methyltransferase family protein [Lachnospiraceae bacterium]
MSVLEKLGKERLFCDGGSGSMLQAWGLRPGELPETWNLTRPDEIAELSRMYFAAGADIVNANTFGANALKYPENLEKIVTEGVRLARRGRAAAGREDGLISVDIGPTGKLLAPLGDLSFDRAAELFGETARFGEKAGADIVFIETMADTYEAKAAVLGAKENTRLPVFLTLTFDAKGKLLTGGDVRTVVAVFEGLGVDALGINCGLGPAQMLPLVRELVREASVPVIVNPNAGLPRTENGKTVYDLDAETFSAYMRQIAEAGAHVIGGCCGTTPEHIRRTILACTDAAFYPPTAKSSTVFTSFSAAQQIGGEPVIIGERINPTGKKRFQEALRRKDTDYILAQGIEQEECGAMALDVNVGLPEIDEPVMMRHIVTSLQAVTALPLQIDTSDPAALEAGLRYYNGKAMVNSVNGKEESVRAVFPLVKKYGGVVVGLTLDENGIPGTAEGRVKIAQRIYAAAASYGIAKKDIVIDALAMAVSSDEQGARVTLETIRRIREELGGHTILGVSNISFGLPRREILSSVFLTMALQAGLDCAIINPGSEAMMRAVYAYRALAGYDPQFRNYIAAYGASSDDPAKPGRPQPLPVSRPENEPQGRSLGECIEKGMKSQAAAATGELLKTTAAMDIVDRELIPALDRVGRGFEGGSVFLPQLLMAADAAQAAFGVIRDSMAGETAHVKGRVILATVKNDIHDIGKNIVKVMLENYGYEVIDLGKDVPPEVIVETAVREDIRLVGLSALMTTTVVSMEETIRLLREKKPDAKVVVGGAVMTQAYADRIGADAYAKDAMETVRYADSVFSNLTSS